MITRIPNQTPNLDLNQRTRKYLELVSHSHPDELKKLGVDTTNLDKLNGEAVKKFAMLVKPIQIQAFCELLKTFNTHELAEMTNPNTGVVHINERIVAAQLLIEKGISPEDRQLELDIVKDEEDFPIAGSNYDKDTKENDGLLRAELVEALIKSGDKSHELIEALKEILNNMIAEPSLSKILENGLNTKNHNFYFTAFLYFLSELYHLDKKSAEEIMKPFGISKESLNPGFISN